MFFPFLFIYVFIRNSKIKISPIYPYYPTTYLTSLYLLSTPPHQPAEKIRMLSLLPPPHVKKLNTTPTTCWRQQNPSVAIICNPSVIFTGIGESSYKSELQWRMIQRLRLHFRTSPLSLSFPKDPSVTTPNLNATTTIWKP